MIGRYLGEFSLSYKPTKHGKAGVGATKGSAHTSLKWLFIMLYIFHQILFIIYGITLKHWPWIDLQTNS